MTGLPVGAGRRRALVLAGMAALTAAGVVLAFTGLSAVRDSTAGVYRETTAPDEPGYRARVVPTPVLAVLQPAAGGGLAGAGLLALEPDDAGGSVVLLPTTTVVPGPDGEEATLEAVYRGEGAEAAVRSLAVAVGVAVPEHTEVDEARWARLTEATGPVEVTIEDPAGDWEAGTVTVEPADVGRFLAADVEGGSALDRVERQQRFWDAWLPLVAEAGGGALPGEVDTGIGRFVLSVAGGGGSAAVLPVRRDDSGEAITFRPDPSLVGSFIARTVPFPRSPAPGVRTRVRLLNGTGEPELTSLAARELVAGGAEIVIAGNTESLDVAGTTVAYTGDRAEQAQRLRDALGAGAVEEVTGGERTPVASDDEIDVTVILGHDAEDLIRR